MDDKMRAAMGRDQETPDPKIYEDAFKREEPVKKIKCNNCMDTGFDSMGDGIAGECLLCPRD